MAQPSFRVVFIEFIKIVSQQEDCRKRWSAEQDELLELRKVTAKLKVCTNCLI